MSYRLSIQTYSVCHDEIEFSCNILPNASYFLLIVEVLNEIIYRMFKWVCYKSFFWSLAPLG